MSKHGTRFRLPDERDHTGRASEGEELAMHQHEIDAELSLPGAEELLGTTAAAHLAYTGIDGTPRVVPVGFYWTGQEVVISTADTAPKVTALAPHPDVALSIDGDRKSTRLNSSHVATSDAV